MKNIERDKMAEKLVHTENYTNEGTPYSIYVYESEGSYWGSWRCLICLKNGNINTRYRTIEEAIRSAKIDLGPAHSLAHLPSQD